MFLTQSLHKGRRERPEVTAILSGERRMSFAQLEQRVARVAGALQSLGIRPGDRVAMLALNSADYLECLFGCWWLGAVVAPMNIRWSTPELAYGIEDSGAVLLLADRDHHDAAKELQRLCPQVGKRVHLGPGAAGEGMLALDALIERSAPVEDQRVGGEAPAALLYTGGTTGKSKGVLLSHDALAIDVLATLEAGPRAPEPVALHCAPMFHIGGIGFSLQAIARLATQILLPAFDPEKVLQLAERERATEMFLVPTMIKRLVEHPTFSRHDLGSVRTLIYGAAPIDPALLDQAMKAFPQAGFVQVYGQTETGPVISCLPPSCHLAQRRDKLGSAGKPVATAEIRIIDEQGQEVAPGSVGEISVRGPTLMLRYWNKPEQTAQTLRGGWLHTGDGGYLDRDGFLHVVDRIKDMIITGGENVFSTEVENALLQHSQVAQCAVIGVPDETWGERVHAVVVPRESGALDPAELMRFCKTLIAGYKCPRSVEFRSELPLSAAGKLLKYQLREPYWAGRARGVA